MTSISSKKPTLNWPAIKWLGIISLFLASCDTPKEIGAELFSVEVGLNLTDTLRVESSTVLIDSIQTGGGSTLLLGSYQHPELGTFQSSFFAQISNADTLTSKATSVLDSVRMSLVYNGYQGDTLQSQTISVYKLKDSLSLSANYYTNSSIPFDANPVAVHTFKPRVIRARSNNGDSLKLDTLSFRMSAAWGNELIKNFSDKTLSGGGKTFRAAFPGLYFKSTSASKAALLGFSPTYSSMTLYWRNPGDATQYSLSYYFSLSTSLSPEVQARFNKFQITKTGALAALVKPGDVVPSTKTNNTTYVQSGSGIVTQIKLPTLLNLKGKNDVAINKAELILSGLDGLDLNNTLGQLTLLQADGKNKPIRNASGLGYIISEGGGGIQIANYNAAFNSYTFNVTTDLQSIMAGRKLNLGYLVTPTLATSTSGMTKMVSESARFVPLNALKARLRVYYSYIAK
jgi:hypothetical protein